jgi:hypothetical protein
VTDVSNLILRARENAVKGANDLLLALGDEDGSRIIRAVVSAYTSRLSQIDAATTVQFLQRLEQLIVPRETKKLELVVDNSEVVR